MRYIDLIGLAVRNVLRRKVRSLLTILGVVIGTAAVTVMLSLGIGMRQGFEAQVAMMSGLTIIEVNRYYSPQPDSRGPVEPTIIDDKVIEQISQLDGVSAVTPIVRRGAKVLSGKYVAYVNLCGVYPESLDKMGYEVEHGRLLKPRENGALLFGSWTTEDFYDPKARHWSYDTRAAAVNVMTDRLQLTLDTGYGETEHNPDKKPAKLYRVRAAGVLAPADGEQNWSVFVDIGYLQNLIHEYNMSQGQFSQSNNSYEQAIVKVPNLNKVENVVAGINAMQLGTFSLQDILQGIKKQMMMVQAVLGGIGAISLFVAALGITNTMVMSIYERTREIGVMKVLGCLLTDIRQLFLWEAGIIGFTGGVLGLLLSLGASALLNRFGGSLGEFLGGGRYSPDGQLMPISIIPPWLALASVCFATLVGLISGFYPARRAMNLSALEAIRSE